MDEFIFTPIHTTPPFTLVTESEGEINTDLTKLYSEIIEANIKLNHWMPVEGIISDDAEEPIIFLAVLGQQPGCENIQIDGPWYIYQFNSKKLRKSGRDLMNRLLDGEMDVCEIAGGQWLVNELVALIEPHVPNFAKGRSSTLPALH